MDSILSKENQLLRAQNENLQKENKTLKEELKHLREQYGHNERGYRLYPRKEILTRVDFGTEERFFIGYTKDISLGGMMIRSERKLELGSNISLTFEAKSFSRPLKIKGQVVWSSSDGMGIKFKDADDYVIEQLKKVLS